MPRLPGAGQPKHHIDWNKVDHYLTCGASGSQVAHRLGIHPETLYDRVSKEHGMSFQEYKRQKRECGEVLVKEAQFDEAVRKRNVSMLIWVGKQMLGQTEKQAVKHEGDVPIQVVSFNGKPLKPWKNDEEKNASGFPD